MAKISKIVFMGTAQFAVPALEYLVTSGYAPILVITQPDRPSGRGQQLLPSPIKELALRHQLPLLQPVDYKTAAVVQQMKSMSSSHDPIDLLIVAAYGRILPEWLLQLPRFGAVNLHGSLLPKYRGAAPIQWSLINGDQQAGVTLMQMVREMDAGDIIEQVSTPITANETYGELADRLSHFAPQLLESLLAKLESGEALTRKPQDPKQSI
jgi:methionyl-tRNA formyltransferase